MTRHGTTTKAVIALVSATVATAFAYGQTPTPAPPTPPAMATPAPAPSMPAPVTPAPTTPAPIPAPPVAATTPPATTSPQSTAPEESSSVQTIQTPSRLAVVLAGTADWENGFKNINAAIAKVRAAVAKAGLTPTGHAIASFVDTDDNGFKFEAMVPIEKAPDGKTDLGEGVHIGATPGGKALKFQHRGAYEDIDTTYEAITAYLDEKNLEAQNVFIEEYLNDPKGADDTSAEVDIYVLIK